MRVMRSKRANSEWALPRPFFRFAVKLNKSTQLALELEPFFLILRHVVPDDDNFSCLFNFINSYILYIDKVL